MHESTHKLKVYTDLLNAITELNLAGGDPYKMDIAKKNLATDAQPPEPRGELRCAQEHQRSSGLSK